ncbi:MAG: PhoU domain-containing protein, partial [Thermodesulfobacteriota bacterium]
INNELERIGDEAVNIAHRVRSLAKRKTMDMVFDYSQMAEKVLKMLKTSLDALEKMDRTFAFQVVAADDEVDALKSAAYDQIKDAMAKNPDAMGYFMNLLLVSRHLERLGDHATNIAEEVIYLIEGEIIRHGKYISEPSVPHPSSGVPKA